MARRKKGDPINGWINLNKPVGISSSKAVAIVKRAFNAQKAGHAGTLDPLADGVLPIALGEATKTVPFIQDSLKQYDFTAIWGERRTTDDREGDVIETNDFVPIPEQVQAVLSQFTGNIEQIPPAFSAIKIDGKRAYALARASSAPEKIEMPKRSVYIQELTMTRTEQFEATYEADSETNSPEQPSITAHGTSFSCICGKGTYIRALARDIAAECGTVGYVGALTRSAVGNFLLQDTISLDFFEGNQHSADLEETLLPVTEVLDDIPALLLTNSEVSRLKHGQRLAFSARHDVQRLLEFGFDPLCKQEKTVLGLTEDQEPIGLLSVCGVRIQPERLFNL